MVAQGYARMNLPLAPLVAGVLGAGVAATCALMPGAMLESLVMDSGLPAVVAAADRKSVV